MSKKNDLKVLRHSAAHLLAHAVSELFPDTLLTIGPATEDGFFYDSLPKVNFKQEDLPLIEARMREIVKRNLPLEHKEISKEEARKLYKNNPFKLELIDQIPGEMVGLATQGDFYDLCRGGHVASTGELANFMLLGISGSYWRADKSKQALQRISGTAFFIAQELEDYIRKQEELLQYDHRRLGKQLDLFSFHEEGVGFPFFHPKGKKVLTILTNYMRKLQGEHNYQEIETPTMLSDTLWQRSGHYAHYKDNMYFSCIDDHVYAIKPMNCPGAILTYQTRPRSYRELPLKLSEFGHVHRHELSGVLHGLMRVRAFTQDDAHIFCTLEQVEHEVLTILKLAFGVLKKVGFSKVHVALSTKPAKAIDSNNNKTWEIATAILKKALDTFGQPYTINEGEGAFYGPKIEIGIEDSMNRTWQCGTVQLDLFQSESFDLSYVTPQGTKGRPVIIHQAIYGSLERFFAILLEHTKGNLPFWLAPLQARILTITDAQKNYAEKIYTALKSHMRIDIDHSSDPLAGQIKTAQLEKIPWMIIVGKKEEETQTTTLRFSNGKQEFNLSINDLLKRSEELNRD